MDSNKFISAKEFFEDLFIEEKPESCSRAKKMKEGFDAPLFNRVKAKMVARINGVTPKRSRRIVAATLKNTEKKHGK